MFKSIRSRFVFSAVIFILLGVGIPTYILLNQFQKNFDQRSVLMLESTVDILRYGLHTAMMLGNEKNIGEVLNKIDSTRGVRHIRIFNEKGIIRFSSEPNEAGKLFAELEPGHIDLKEIKNKSVRLIKPEGVYMITEPIINNEDCRSCHNQPEIIDYLDVDTELTTAEVVFYTGTKHMIFMGIAIVIVLLSGLYFIFSYFISSPLNKLINALKVVESGNLNIVLPDKRKDEMGSVFSRFNLMTLKLKSSRDEIAELHFEQLQRANRLKILGELTSQMAHEINNHTAIVMSRADYLNLESGNKQELINYRNDFNVILDQTNKISVITNNILRHSKKSVKRKYRINLIDSVNRSLQLIEPMMVRNNIRLNLKMIIQPAYISGDALEIEQVLINLLKNSIDAIDNDGEIRILLTEKKDNTEFELKLCDNGCGIENDNLNQIFSPFYTSKEEEKGTGLGLYIVQNICRQHNIEINVDSEFGKGTCFTLIFKVLQEQ